MSVVGVASLFHDCKAPNLSSKSPNTLPKEPLRAIAEIRVCLWDPDPQTVGCRFKSSGISVPRNSHTLTAPHGNPQSPTSHRQWPFHSLDGRGLGSSEGSKASCSSLPAGIERALGVWDCLGPSSGSLRPYKLRATAPGASRAWGFGGSGFSRLRYWLGCRAQGSRCKLRRRRIVTERV